jgi:nitrogen-specific signal transduction histidine kinase
MMETLPDALTTHFASAKRLANTDLQKQIDLFNKEYQLRTFLDGIPEIVLILNEHRQVIFANKVLFETLGVNDGIQIFGKRPGELLNCKHATEMLAGCGTSVFCEQCGAVNSILESQNGRENKKECLISAQNNINYEFRVNSKPIEVEGHAFTLFTISDIRDEKRRHALERIFFHDIINTAGGLRGFLQLLKTAEEDEKPSMIQTIELISNRLLDEIQAQNELLHAEQGDLGTFPVEIESIGAIGDVIDVYREHHVCKNRRIEIDPNTVNCTFSSDYTLLCRVIGNMVKNALEATPPKGIVTIKADHTDSAVIFSVHNDTVMPKEVQLQMFNRSFSTKGKGRGLGTHSIKLLGEYYLKGRVRFTSIEGEGTTFFLELPIVSPIGGALDDQSASA